MAGVDALPRLGEGRQGRHGSSARRQGSSKTCSRAPRSGTSSSTGSATRCGRGARPATRARQQLERKRWEIRARSADGIASAIYLTAAGQRVVIVHAFVKKTQKTPKAAIDLARRRAREVLT
ncbi:MAG: type II toxin-antitoxin system RelE/ParE family toxin [Nitrococcus sp.]|nr:type II toxin-antitoxin system RelE/ParE family toxin [Nitrococcus sp.]